MTSMMVGFAYMLRGTLILVLMYPQTMRCHFQTSDVDHHTMIEGEGNNEKEGDKHKPEQVPSFSKVYTVLQNC